MSLPTVVENEKPKLPKVSKFSPEDKKEIFNGLWCMRYLKQGQLGFKFFLHEGTRVSAIDRAKQHCAITQRKHLVTTHALHDLDLEEAKGLEGLGADLG